MSRPPLNNQSEFFKCMQQGMQRYFDKYDRQFGGILYFTVGVREGKVGGIVRSEDTLYYEKPKIRKTSKKTRNNE